MIVSFRHKGLKLLFEKDDPSKLTDDKASGIDLTDYH
jgi:hypothetical protein